MSLASEHFNAALAELIREQSSELVRRAYEHGYQAALKEAKVDKASYRRGYLAGYWTGRRKAEPSPDGAETGRPRAELVTA